MVGLLRIELDRLGIFHKSLVIFLFATIYAFCAFAVSREAIIPAIFGSTSGLIPGDPEYYDHLAKLRASAMKENGLAAFEHAPDGHGVVGIVSLVYFIVPYAYAIVALNAVLHGLASMTMFLLLSRWFSLKAALLGALPVLTAPYMMLWFSQPNKDTFVLAGTLLFVYGLTGINSSDRNSLWRNAGIAIFGAFVIGWVKPYINQILFPFVLAVIFGCYILNVYLPTQKIAKHSVLAGCAILGALLLFSQGGRANDTLRLFYDNRLMAHMCGTQQSNVCDQCLDAVSDWETTEVLPGVLERRLKALAGQRCLMFSLLGSQDHPATLASIIERDFMPRSSVEMLAYIPRAMAIGVLSPFPATWFLHPGGRVSVFYTLVPFEAALVYLGIVGFAVFVIRNWAFGLTIPILLAIYVMTVYGMSTPYVGALYRYRYPFWEILLCFGVAAFWSLLHKEVEANR